MREPLPLATIHAVLAYLRGRTDTVLFGSHVGHFRVDCEIVNIRDPKKKAEVADLRSTQETPGRGWTVSRGVMLSEFAGID